jgi:hypothetical protein
MRNVSVALMIVGVTCIVCALMLRLHAMGWVGLGVVWFGELVPRFTHAPVVIRDRHRPAATRPVDQSPGRKSA